MHDTESNHYHSRCIWIQGKVNYYQNARVSNTQHTLTMARIYYQNIGNETKAPSMIISPQSRAPLISFKRATVNQWPLIWWYWRGYLTSMLESGVRTWLSSEERREDVSYCITPMEGLSSRELLPRYTHAWWAFSRCFIRPYREKALNNTGWTRVR